MKTTNNYTIVVGVDYREPSDVALSLALNLSAESKNPTELHVVHVWSVPAQATAPEITGVIPLEEPNLIRAAAERLREHVDQVLRSFEEAHSSALGSLARVVSHLRFDEPARELAQLASDVEADLVIVGTHGKRGLSKVLTGSVVDSLLKFAPCPVLVAKPKALDPDGPIEAPCTGCLEIRRITNGTSMWCEQHLMQHGERHYHHLGATRRERESA